MTNTELLKELKGIAARLEALMRQLEPREAEAAVTASVGEVRRLAVLDAIYRCGRPLLPEEISAICSRYGRDPSGSAGYYSGRRPSLRASTDRKTRMLTPDGEALVREARQDWGEDWVDRLPMDLVGSPHTPPETEISF